MNDSPLCSAWNILDHLQSEDDILAYLRAAEEDGDPALIEAVKADIALARETHSLFPPDESL